jgi:pimeloyl-ACP methyl ester carboxylesterase
MWTITPTILTRTAVLAAVAVQSIGAAPQSAVARNSNPKDANMSGRYATVNGLKMYYETHGGNPGGPDLPPLVLLHGAMSTIDTDFSKVLPRLAATRRIIAIEQQGHGHTADIDRPLTYEQMANDTAELLKKLDVRNADFFGYSMGGGIVLQVAKRHPSLVRRLIFAGAASYNPSGFYSELIEAQRTLKPEQMAGTPFERAYAKVAPHPEAWPRLVEKTKQLDLAWAGFPPDDLRAIKIPTLLIIGDADVVRPEHTVEMFRLLGGGVAGDLHGLPPAQLAVLPGTTHITLVDHVDWLASMVTAFLMAPTTPTPIGPR